MDVLVSTGSTKASGQSLVSQSFDSPHKEKVVFLVQTAGGPEADTLAQECAGIIRHALLEGEGEPWHRLDGTLKELNGLFKGFLLSKAMDEMHAVVALLDAQGTLHVSHAGRGEAYLVRGNTTSQITEFSRGKPLSVFVHISSGVLEEGDCVVFSTQRLLRSLTPAQLGGMTGGDPDEVLSDIAGALESERETAALALLTVGAREGKAAPAGRQRSAAMPSRRDRRRGTAVAGFTIPSLEDVTGFLKRVQPVLQRVTKSGAAMGKKSMTKGAAIGKQTGPALSAAAGFMAKGREKAENFLADLRHPERKRRAHLLLLAGAVAAFLTILVIVNLITSSQRNKDRAELAALVAQIEEEIKTADNRKLAGDMEAANTILRQAEEKAKQVIADKGGYFKTEAGDLLDRIQDRRESLNNITRVSPRMVVNVSTKNPDVAALGLIGLNDGEFIVYDRQNSYRVLLNKLDDPHQIADQELVLQGTYFDRQKTQVYVTTGQSLIEMAGSQATPMKTDDPEGWVAGKDIEAYLRYLYVLAPEKKQIYKYERLTNRYSAPVNYNVNGDLTGALDMSIDGSVYVLKEGGTVLKLLRGEVQPFKINGAPENILKNAAKMYKVPEGNFYFLDPSQKRVIVVTDGGVAGEAKYERQFAMEAEQLGTPQDLYVDPDESHLYVLDEKRVFVVDLSTQ